MNNDTNSINLGGFPPIYVIDVNSKNIKDIKEFSNKDNIKIKNKNLLNILNIKDILNSVKNNK